MAYVVNQNCLGCRFTDCVDVCPIKDCFRIGGNMLVIDPRTCIDCGLCVPACPADAISHDSKADVAWIEHNGFFSQVWPAINCSIPPLENADLLKKTEDKESIFDKTMEVL
jgi:ferredoxin